MQFQVGDLVQHEEYGFGKVVHLLKHVGNWWYGIEFNKSMGGHDCNGNCKNGYGYYAEPEFVTLYDKDITIKEYAERLHKQAI